MNKEILKRNIEQVIMQPCLANPWNKADKKIKENGLSGDGTHIMVKVTTDDSSWQCNLVDRDGNPIDYVERILEMMPEKYRDHIVTLKHTNWIYYSYEPVFDTDTQAMWDKELDTFYKAKQEWSEDGWTMQDEEELQIALDTLVKAGQHSSAKWLKNVCLRPQNTWKPSKEQLRELRCVISGCSFDTPVLVELEEDLKKLWRNRLCS